MLHLLPTTVTRARAPWNLIKRLLIQTAEGINKGAPINLWKETCLKLILPDVPKIPPTRRMLTIPLPLLLQIGTCEHRSPRISVTPHLRLLLKLTTKALACGITNLWVSPALNERIFRTTANLDGLTIFLFWSRVRTVPTLLWASPLLLPANLTGANPPRTLAEKDKS